MVNDNQGIFLTGLWASKEKEGHFIGPFAFGAQLFLVKNSRSGKDERQPDFLLYLVPKEKANGEKEFAGSDGEIPF